MIKLFLTINLLLLCIGCAHVRGNVALKLDDQNAIVCLGDDDLRVGHLIAFVKNQCPTSGKNSSSVSCEKVKLGYGVVTEVYNEHYSKVQLPEVFPFNEGTLVEKQ